MWSKRFVLFFLALALGPAQSYALTLAMDLLQISSQYRDGLTNKVWTVNGIGSLVRVGKKYFALTASHVSQGQNLEIHLGERALSPGRQIADLYSDVALIEVSGLAEKDLDQAAAAEWSADIKAFEVPIDKRWSWWRLIEINRRNELAEDNPGYIQIDWNEIVVAGRQFWSASELSHINEMFYNRFFLNGSSFDLNRRQQSGLTMSLRERSTAVKLKPGTSGAPSIRMYQGVGRDFSILLTGVVTRAQRYSDFSHLSSQLALQSLVDRARSSREKKSIVLNPQMSWQVLGGITHRVLRSEISWQEILPPSLAAGEATSTSVGNGTSGDGGNGTSGDGGSGAISVDPLSLSAGMSYNGKTVLGFRLNHHSQSLDLNASVSTLGLIDVLKKKNGFEPIVVEAGDSLGNRFRDQLQKRTGQTRGTLQSEKFPKNSCSLQWDEQQLIVRVLDADGASEITVKTQWERTNSVLAKDSSDRWIADLTELFFIEPSYHQMGLLGNFKLGTDAKDLFESAWQGLLAQSGKLSLSLRPKDLSADHLGQEIVCSFELARLD